MPEFARFARRQNPRHTIRGRQKTEVAVGADVDAARQKIARLVQRAVKALAAADHDHEPITEPFGMLHRMRGEQDRFAVPCQMAEEIFKFALIDRIEPDERFIENDEVGVVCHCRQKLHFLSHTLR